MQAQNSALRERMVITMKKILENIRPWNDLYFKNCYYSALFPMVEFLGGTAAPVILNDLYYFRESKDDDGLVRLENDEIYPNYDVCLNEMGITVMNGRSCDIVADIRRAIDAGSPAMVFIDCFFERMRTDAYNLNHWTHILPVYGYDDEAGELYFFEHQYQTGFTYGLFTMPYAEMENCYNGYIEKSKHGGFSTYYLNRPLENVREYERGAIEKFVEAANKKRKKIDEGVELLRSYADGFDKTLARAYQEGDLKNKLYGFNDRTKLSKSVQRYRLVKYFGVGRAAELAERLAEHWNLVKLLAHKMMSGESGVYAELHVKKLREIPELESEYNEAFYKTINQFKAGAVS